MSTRSFCPKFELDSELRLAAHRRVAPAAVGLARPRRFGRPLVPPCALVDARERVLLPRALRRSLRSPERRSGRRRRSLDAGVLQCARAR